MGPVDIRQIFWLPPAGTLSPLLLALFIAHQGIGAHGAFLITSPSAVPWPVWSSKPARLAGLDLLKRSQDGSWDWLCCCCLIFMAAWAPEMSKPLLPWGPGWDPKVFFQFSVTWDWLAVF